MQVKKFVAAHPAHDAEACCHRAKQNKGCKGLVLCTLQFAFLFAGYASYAGYFFAFLLRATVRVLIAGYAS